MLDTTRFRIICLPDFYLKTKLLKCIKFHVIMYECETSYLILKEENRRSELE